MCCPIPQLICNLHQCPCKKENAEVLKCCWLRMLPCGMAYRAHRPLVCVEPSVIKGCYSAGRTEVKFVPLTQGIFQEVCLSDRVVRNVPARLWIFLINGDARVSVFSNATLVCATTCLLVYLFILITRTPKEKFIKPVKDFLHLTFSPHLVLAAGLSLVATVWHILLPPTCTSHLEVRG